jgi:sulfur relay (sulfurtransferase) DsrC/TusE family protein
MKWYREIEEKLEEYSKPKNEWENGMAQALRECLSLEITENQIKRHIEYTNKYIKDSESLDANRKFFNGRKDGFLWVLNDAD